MRDKKYKSLIFRLQHLQAELDDRNELIDSHKVKFDVEVKKIVNEYLISRNKKEERLEDIETSLVKRDDLDGTENLKDNIEEDPESNPKEDETDKDAQSHEAIPDVFKKLWKLIATATHPDKTNNDVRLTTIYKEASEHYKKRDFSNLIVTSLELGILSNIMDPSLTPYINECVQTIENKINHIESLILWKWINCENENDKNLYITMAATALMKQLEIT